MKMGRSDVADVELPGWAGGGGAPFKLVARVMKAHTRVIWTCSWAPDGRMFATGARDGTVKLWALTSTSGTLLL